MKRESEAEQKKESEAAQMRLKAVKNPFGTLENPFANSNIQLPSWMNIKGGQKSTSTSTSEEGENKKFPFGFLSHMRVLPFLRINRAGMC